MSDQPEPISDSERRALQRELTELHAQRAELAATLQDPEGDGDAVDHADRERRAMNLGPIDERIARLTDRLRTAAAGGPATDMVGVGSTVQLRFADGSVDTVEIAAIDDESDPSLVTADSPLGRALAGHRAGDTVGYDAPAGAQTAVVLSVGHGDPAAG